MTSDAVGDPRVFVVRVEGDAASAGTLDYVAQLLEGSSIATAELIIPASGLPRDRRARRAWKSFKHTPDPLLESWRVARHLEARTQPGDTLVLSDHGGYAGMFALEQAAVLGEERRQVVVIAARSATLDHLSVAGTIDNLPAEIEGVVDWELVAYQSADRVWATSQSAVALLEEMGLGATLVGHAIGTGSPQIPRPPSRVYLPERVARTNQTPAILRALSGLLDSFDDLLVAVSTQDSADLLWGGTTWQAMSETVAVFGDRVRREDLADPDVVVLGGRFAPPPPVAASLRDAGVPVVVPAGSTAAVMWPEAATWSTEDDLVAALTGPSQASPGPGPSAVELPGPRPLDSTRATRVSVGVPIFRRVDFLDRCLGSLVAQEQSPHEILLVDDGSRSREVTERISHWTGRYPDLIRSFAQPNRGVCVARNTALEAMTGNAFVLVDADDELDPEFITACAEALRADPGLWAVATWTEFFGAYQGVEGKPPFDRRVGRRENPIVSTCVLVDMKVRDQGIRFEPDLAFLFCEDWDVWAKIVAAGGRIGLVPRPLARHRVHVSSGGFRRTDLARAVGKARATRRLWGTPLRDPI